MTMATQMMKKTAFTYMFISVLLSYACIDLSADLLFAVMLGIAILGAVCAFLILLLISLIKRSRSHAVTAMVLFLSLMTTAAVAGIVIPRMHERTIKKAAYIINKIETYKSEHGEYPKDIQTDLNLSDSDRETEMGIFVDRYYRYVRHDEGYTVYFDKPGWVQSRYHSKDKAWGSHD